jgi:hypothetical protein
VRTDGFVDTSDTIGRIAVNGRFASRVFERGRLFSLSSVVAGQEPHSGCDKHEIDPNCEYQREQRIPPMTSPISEQRCKV